MFSPLARIAFLTVLALLSGCATNEFAATKSEVAGLNIKGAHVYVYSFLDVRDPELGPTMTAEVNAQLTKALAAADVQAKVLPFKASEIGRYSTLTNGNVRIPVRETVFANLAQEREFGAQYRMVIFPSNMQLQGAWKHYDIKWDLFDAQSGKLVWSTTSHGKHMTTWKVDEDPQPRAKIIVDGIIAEFKNSHLY